MVPPHTYWYTIYILIKSLPAAFAGWDLRSTGLGYINPSGVPGIFAWSGKLWKGEALLDVNKVWSKASFNSLPEVPDFLSRKCCVSLNCNKAAHGQSMVFPGIFHGVYCPILWVSLAWCFLSEFDLLGMYLQSGTTPRKRGYISLVLEVICCPPLPRMRSTFSTMTEVLF